MSKIKCYVCDKEVERRQAEINRSIRLGRKFYCSRSCCGKGNHGHLPIGSWHDKLVRTTDEYSPFRIQWRSARRRAEEDENEFDISLDSLKQQWDKQQGICPYTGWKLDNPSSSSGKRESSPYRASLDRIDSKKGYTQENIQFVSYMANCAKNHFTEKQLVEFCKAVADRH